MGPLRNWIVVVSLFGLLLPFAGAIAQAPAGTTAPPVSPTEVSGATEALGARGKRAVAPSAEVLALVRPSPPAGALVATAVRDRESGTWVLGEHSALLLHPASTLKLVTAATFLSRGAPQLGVETALYATADRRLVLCGSGDALLSVPDLLRLAAAVPEDRRGDAIEVLSLFGPPSFGAGWMWDDEPFGFQPFVSGLCLNGGTLEVTERIGAEGQGFFEIFPDTGEFRRAPHRNGEMRTTREVFGHPRILRVPASLPASRLQSPATRRLSVRDPDLSAGIALRAALEGRLDNRAGPLPDGEPPALERFRVQRFAGSWGELAEMQKLAETTRDCQDLLRATLLDSDNLSAECLLRLLALRKDPTALAEGKDPVALGLAEVRAHLQAIGVPASHHAIVDGSGLSHYNLLSAEALVRVLGAAAELPAKEAQALRAALPQMGATGTLKNRGGNRPGAARCRAKTGTLRGISALAGEVQSADGRTLDFAILVQNALDSAAARRLVDDFATGLAEAKFARD